MQTIRKAIIAAAGMGRRLGHNIPKCLVEVEGKKIIEYQLELLKDFDEVRIVVGYKADEVIRFVKNIRDDVIFVVNKDYQSTNTLQSLNLAKHGIGETCLIMDGDVIVSKKSFERFVNLNHSNTIGISRADTDDAVYVHTLKKDNETFVEKFSRQHKSLYEWANVAIINTNILCDKNIYVYEVLDKYLPLKAFLVDRVEIDTENDLILASQIIKSNRDYSYLNKI